MIKTLRNLFSQDKEQFKVPKSVQQAIPIQAIWEDGIFLVGKNKYAKTYKFTDINYAVASREDKEAMFLEYSELLNSFDSGATTKITIVNRRLNKADFEKAILIPYKDDGLDIYRKEYNKMLLEKATGANSIIQEKFVTISIFKKSIEDARAYFARVSADIISHFARLGSKCTELDATEKLRILHDFYRTGEETDFRFELSETMRKGHDFKDFICPDTLEFEKDHFKIGNRYGRVLFLREYASYIKDSMIAELTDLNRNLMMSIDVIPIPTDEAVREVETRLLGVETNITNWQRKQNQNNNYSAVVPYDMEQQRKESKEFLDDLTTRDQRMMFAVLTMVHTADTLEQLDSDTDALLTTTRKHLCQFAILKYQQMDGLNTAMPIGLRKIDALRTLTTESLAVFMPFRVQEIMDTGGIYFGENAISHNLIMCNKAKLLNANAFLLGVPGSGKSFSAKELIAFLALATQDDILICDPEREYASLINAMGGEVIRIAAGSRDHINALDMVEGYGDGSNPVIDKSEFVLSLFEQLDKKGLGAKEKSIIDRCTAAVYADYQRGGELPTLCVLREKLLSQDEPEARELALSLELFTSGSLNAFAHPTNVDVQNRMVVYDIM
ncbi:MAG: VirB4-like conjugal transfer ATPase, CD1110 family, partial [Pirellulaceae bacterium]